MSIVLTIAHPVPFRFRPRGARTERMALLRVDTPVRIRGVDPQSLGAGFERAEPARLRKTVFREIEGRLFVRAFDGSRDDASDLFGFLGERIHQGGGTLSDAFAGTPVMADCPSIGYAAWSADCRGGLVGEAGVRDVIEDTTNAARRSLHAWFARDVRLVGRDLYVDTGGPLYAADHLRHDAVFRERLFPRKERAMDDAVTGPVTLAQARRMRRDRLDLEAREGKATSPTGSDRQVDVPRVPGVARVVTDTETLFANRAPATILGMMKDVINSGTRGPLGDPAIKAGVAELRWLALRGAILGIEADEAPAVARQVAAMARNAMAMAGVVRWHATDLMKMHAHATQWVLPRLAASQPDILPEDEESLSVLVV